MAALRLFRFAAVPTWPRGFGGRLLVYLAVSLAAWLAPPWGALTALLGLLALGRRIHWWAWGRALGWLWVFVLAPAALALIPPMGPDLPQALWRSLTFLTLLAASHWLSATSTILEIRTALEALFRVFGQRLAASLSLLGTLALCFLPWVMEQLDAVRQASALRGGSNRNPLLALRALSVPLFVRMIEKARHTADALELRGR
jgi:energy-coupling factor transporter transmembrane protein EcfT